MGSMHNATFVRRLLTLSVPLTLVLAGAGCTGDGTMNSALGVILNTTKQHTLLVRVVNNTQSDLEVDIRVDGEIKQLPLCTALQQTCDYILSSCPTTIEVIQETRRNADGQFMGGRNFETNPAFIFTQGEFECGDTLLLEFSVNSASAQAL